MRILGGEENEDTGGRREKRKGSPVYPLGSVPQEALKGRRGERDAPRTHSEVFIREQDKPWIQGGGF